MAYWIFKCNPNHYRLEDRLADPNPTITWGVRQHRDKINAGDVAFLWVTGPERGIRAILTVAKGPSMMVELETEQKYCNELESNVQLMVLGTLTHRSVNLASTDLRAIGGLKDSQVFTGFKQATNVPITDEEGEILMGLAESSN